MFQCETFCCVTINQQVDSTEWIPSCGTWRRAWNFKILG